jgi:hypothetical protein
METPPQPTGPTVLIFTKFAAEFYQRISQPKYNVFGQKTLAKEYGHVPAYVHTWLMGSKSPEYPKYGADSIADDYGPNVFPPYSFLTYAQKFIINFDIIKRDVCNNDPDQVKFIDTLLSQINHVERDLGTNPYIPLDEETVQYLQTVFGDANTEGSIRQVFGKNDNAPRVLELVKKFDVNMNRFQKANRLTSGGKRRTNKRNNRKFKTQKAKRK